MPIEAELFDGTVLEFPDDTQPSIIQSKAKELTFQRQGKPYFSAIGGDVIKRAFEPPPVTSLPPDYAPTTSRLNPGRLSGEQLARGIGEVGQQITPFPGLVGALSGVRKPGTLPELVNPMPEVVTNAFSSVLEAIRNRDPSLAKDVEAVMAVAPFHGPPVGSIKPALQSIRSRLPFPQTAPPAPTINDLIAQQRPGLPAPSEVKALPAPAGPRALPEPEMVLQGTPPLETPGGATIASEISRAPKRTIVDLVDEIKADIKDRVIQELADELRTGRGRAAAAATTPKQVPLQIEGPRKVLPPPKSVIYEGTPGGELRATSALNRPIVGGGELSDLQRLQLNLRSANPETTTTIAPGSTQAPPARVTPQPVSEVAPAAIEAPASPKIVMGESGYRGAEFETKPKFTAATPIEDVLPPRVAKAPHRANNKEVEAMADSKIRQLVNVEGPVEFKGKTYTGAIREGNNVRLRDNPDKVLKKADDILQVEEKVPFDIPPAQAAPFDPSRLKAAVQLDDGETIVGTAGRGGHKDIFEALSPQSQQKVKATGFFDPTDPNPKNFYADSRAAEQAYNARAGIETAPVPAPTRKIKGPNGELVEVPAEVAQQSQKPTGLENVPDVRLRRMMAKGTRGERNLASREIERRKVANSDIAEAKQPPNPPAPDIAMTKTAAAGESGPVAKSELDSIAAIQDPQARLDALNAIQKRVDSTSSSVGQGNIQKLARDLRVAATKEKISAPTFEQTPAGKQAVIPGAEGREVPLTPLRPKRAQTEKPMDLEQPGIRAKEPGLFEKPSPTPESQLSAEEIAARDEMRGLLGGEKKRGLTGLLKSEKGQFSIPGREPLPGEPTVGKPRLVAAGLGEESSKTLSKTMGPEGAELARLSKAVRNDAEIEAHTAATAVNKTLRELDKKQLDNLVNVLEGKARAMDSDVQAAFTAARTELDKVAARAQEVKLEITNPITKEKYPFQPRENYFPHMFGQELGEYVKNPAARVDIKAQIKAQIEAAGKKVTDKQVEQALNAMLKAAKGREGHLEIARIFNRPDYSRDPGRVLNKHFQDAYRRINIAEKFKPDLSKGEELLTAIGQKTNSDFAEEFARKYFQRVTGTEPVNRLAHEAVNTAVNLNNFSLLGQASIANASQPVYTAILTGAKRTAQGYAKAMTAEGREFASKILGSSAREFMEDVAAAQGSSTSGKLADFVLKYTGFNFTERMNRIVSANAGRVYARDTFDKLLKNPAHKGLRETLEKMNVGVDEALKRGSLSELDELKAGQNIINRTQFKTDVTELPLFWTSESGRLLTQYKKFQFKSGQFVKDEILKEIAKGNIVPLARAAAIAPVAGYAVATARDAIRFGKQTEQERGLADYLAVVGTFGAFTDAFAGSGRQPVRGLQYLAGPTLGRAGQLWEAGTAIAREGNVRPAAKFAASSVPVVGPSIRQIFNEPAKSDRQKFAEELGLERESMSRKKMKKQLGLER